MCHLLVIPSLYTPPPTLHQHCGRPEIPTLKPILLLILVINHSTSWSKLKRNKRDKPIFSLQELWGVRSVRLADSPTRKHWGKQAQSEEGTGTTSRGCWSQQTTQQGLPRGPSRHWQWQSPQQRREGKHHPAGHALRLLNKREGRNQVAWRTEAGCPARGSSRAVQLLIKRKHTAAELISVRGAANFGGYWF